MSALRALAWAALLGAGAAAAVPPDASDPWLALDRLRHSLAEAGALQGDFVQTFTPAGFTSGETESGRVAVSMPDCLRWDYVEPYRKSFLVCGSRAWSWAEGEPRGQRVTIDADQEMGLDLLLLSAAELKQRYRASAVQHAGGELALALEPLDPEAPLVAAELTLTAGALRPGALDYRDRAGNVTSFRFSNWRALEEAEAFSPPPELEWDEP